MTSRIHRMVVALFLIVLAGSGFSALAEEPSSSGAAALSPAPAPSVLALGGGLADTPGVKKAPVVPRSLMLKKPSDAFLRSVILPGWGQRYANRPFRGAIFTSADAGIWVGLLYSYQAWKLDEGHYQAFGQQHASIQGDHDHNFYVDMGNFDNRDEFNAFQRQQREYDNQYRGADNWWEWDSSDNRLTFKNLRIQADRNKTRISYLVGALLLNRIVSAIDASRGLAKKQRAARGQNHLSLEYDAQVNGPSLVWRGNLAGK